MAIIVGWILVIPSWRYYLKISENKNYDYLNIFLQTTILKLFIMSFSIILLYLLGYDRIEKGAGLAYLAQLLVRIVTYLIFIAFITIKHFAIR